jgi:flagellin-specific chaperone FliS
MNPYQKYRRQDEVRHRTRMDALLAMYDKALERLDAAEAAFRAGNRPAAVAQIAKTQLIVIALAAGVRVVGDSEISMTILRLYEYAVRHLGTPSLDGIEIARTALRTLRTGFEAVRAEANELERAGHIPALDQLQLVHATA